MIRTAFQFKSAMLILVVLMGVGVICAATGEQVPPKELLQFIHESRRSGLEESKIKKQAIAVGWTESAIDEAIAYDKSGKPLPVASDATGSPKTAAPQPTPGSAPVSTASAPVQPPPETSSAASATLPKPDSKVHGAGDDYLIGAGDTIQVSVWNEKEASVPSVVVRPDGKITVPLIKDVEVAGLTPRQAEAAITEGLGKFINDPNVTVVIATINSKKVYLIGAVKKEGTLPYTYGMTVMQALSEAGGLTDYAKRKRIYVLRTENGREYRLDFNYEEVIRGERMEQNVVLLAGDTVVIPQ